MLWADCRESFAGYAGGNRRRQSGGSRAPALEGEGSRYLAPEQREKEGVTGPGVMFMLYVPCGMRC